jgi:two-component system, NtrC family, sensor histidine kinase KinB
MKKLRYPVGVGYLVILAVILGLGVYQIVQSHQCRVMVSRHLAKHDANVRAISQMIFYLDEQKTAQISISARFDSLTYAQYQMYRDQFLANCQIVTQPPHFPEERLILESVIQTYKSYLDASEAFIRDVRSSNPAAILSAEEQLISIERKLRIYCRRLLEINQFRSDAAERLVRRESHIVIPILIAVAAGLAFVFSIRFQIQITRTFVRPVRMLHKMLGLVRTGEPYPKIDFSTSDELAEVVAEFNKMTERLRAYEEMNIQEIIAEKKKSEAIVESLTEPVVVTGRGRIILMNQAAAGLFGLRGKPEGRNIRKSLKDPRLVDLLCGEPGDSKSGGLIAMERGGQTLFFKPHQTVISEADRFEWLVTLFQDVTQFKNLDRMKSDFIATVSHEFRTPLTSMHMTLDILSRGVVGRVNDKQRELLAAAKEDSNRLTKMIQELLDLARLESGGDRLIMGRIRIDDLVAETLKPFALPIEEKKIVLDVSLRHLPEIWGDPQKLSWAVANLVNNAIRFSREGGMLTINGEVEDGEVRVYIRDTGRGISVQDQTAIFDKFVQIKHAGDSTPGSVGLGLAIAREAVEAHGGRIWVESEPGRGSTFTFSIPLARPS